MRMSDRSSDVCSSDLINARRSNAHKLGLALHIGFMRLSGRLLNSVRIVPTTLWRHLGDEIGITAVELASLRALYVRGRTLFDHQPLACDVLGRSEEHTSELQSLMRTSYAVSCWKKKKHTRQVLTYTYR